MRVLLDACVLYPTVMREMLIGAAATGAYQPLWSARILAEWSRAAVKLGAAGAAQADAEIVMLRAHWPLAELSVDDGLTQPLWLPDENDIHVLAAAISGQADAICTLNNKDFPRGLLAEHGIERTDPDTLLMGYWHEEPAVIETVGSRVLEQAQRLSGKPWDMRKLLKKARLPRLAKALSRSSGTGASSAP